MSEARLTKRARLIPAVLELLNEYSTTRVTIRQLFYVLLSRGIIKKNTKATYCALDRRLTEARVKGQIPFSKFQDQSRVVLGDFYYGFEKAEDVFFNAKDTFESAEDTFNGCADDFGLPLWYGQPYHVEVWLEKQALANVFEQVTSQKHIRLAPCRGYPSVTFLYESALWMKRYVPKDKKLVILYFGDFDMRGHDIERHIGHYFSGFGLDVEIKRIALTKEQIEQYNLPPAPAKQGDPMARGWIDSQGDVAWELDALEPKVLQSLISQAIDDYFDMQAYQTRTEELEKGKQRISEMLEQYNNGEDVAT
jgi:hypothetical protein